MKPRGTIGASDIAGLFNESPYESRYSLFLRETGMRATEDDAKTERQQLGLDLEEAIIRTWSKRENCEVVLNREPMRRGDIAGLSATPDALKLYNAQPEPIDAKTVMPHERRAWLDGVPRHYWWQSQAQSLICRSPRGWIVALFGVQELAGTEIPADEGAHVRICQEVATFWRQVRGEIAPPPPDDHRATIAALMLRKRERKIVNFGDAQICEMMCAVDAEYQEARAARLAAEKREDKAKAAILNALADADAGVFADGSGYRVDVITKNIKAKAATTQTQRKLTRFTGENTEEGENE